MSSESCKAIFGEYDNVSKLSLQLHIVSRKCRVSRVSSETR